MEITLVFVLLFLFQLKHWVCDYPLQTPYMLQKFKKEGWVLPLAVHAGVHCVGTMLIVIVVLGENHRIPVTSVFSVYTPVLLGLFDFVVHFITDRIKAHPSLGGKYKPDQPQFWWCLGADQMVHHFTHYVIIAAIVYNFS